MMADPERITHPRTEENLYQTNGGAQIGSLNGNKPLISVRSLTI